MNTTDTSVLEVLRGRKVVGGCVEGEVLRTDAHNAFKTAV